MKVHSPLHSKTMQWIECLLWLLAASGLVSVLGACSTANVTTDKSSGAIIVDIPRGMDHAADDPAITTEAAHTVSLLPTGEWYIGNRGYSDKYAFRDALADYLKDSPEKMIYLQAGGGSAYGQMVEPLNSIRKAGGRSVGLVVAGPDSTGKPGRLAVRLPLEQPETGAPSADQKLQIDIDVNGKMRLGKSDAGIIAQPAEVSNLLNLALKLNPDRSVTIRPTRGTRYRDLAKLIDAVTATGADPIILALDNLNDR